MPWCSIRRDLDVYLSDFDAAYQRRLSGLKHFHMALVYDRRGHRIAVASNRHGDRSQGAGFDRYTLHAERAALRAVGDQRLLRDATLVVMRFDARGEVRCSMPCHACRAHILSATRKHGLGRVVYSS